MVQQPLAGMLLGVSLAAFLAPGSSIAQTITGRLVDAACYELDKANVGADHNMPQGVERDCAVACVKSGLPVALLTSDGKVYIVTGALVADNNAKLVPYLGHRVTLTGHLSSGIGPILMMEATDLTIVGE